MPKNRSISIAVRATNERTADVLEKQLGLQMKKNDILQVFSKQEPLFMKMNKVFKWSIDAGKEISIVIDADILVRKGLLNVIRENFTALKKTDAGFGIQLFDRFFHRPKFRGIFVYKASVLPLFYENY